VFAPVAADLSPNPSPREHPNCANVSYKQGSRGALGAGELSEQGSSRSRGALGAGELSEQGRE